MTGRRAPQALTVALLAWTAMGCRSPEAKKDPGAGPASSAPTAARADAGAELFASPSSRCGQCHGDFEAQWRASAHAHASSAPAYVAMRAHADGPSCDGCHAPLDRLLPPDDPARHDAVSCDVCHTMSAVDARREGAGFVLHVDDTTKYGPLCDAKNNYFHKVGCSPLHAQSEMCAACHLMYARAASASEELPVFTEYEEWQASRYAAVDQTCQDCHMPEETTAVAVGARRRGGVAHHDFGAAAPHFRSTALSVRASVESRDGKLVVHATLHNDAAGHAVPTGLPERRVVLRAATFDAAHRRVVQVERAYGRMMVDAAGAPAPFYAAARVAADTRIQVDETREESMELDLPTAGELRVDVVWQAVAPEIAATLGLPPQEVVLQHGTAKIDAPGHRPSLEPVTMGVPR